MFNRFVNAKYYLYISIIENDYNMEDNVEIWVVVPEYEDYQVSSFGRVKSIKFGKEIILKSRLATNGYLSVILYKGSKPKTIRVHRLVWSSFNGPIPDGYEINHIDENKQNNRLDNLNLMTRRENVKWGSGVERRAAACTNGKNSKPVLQFDLEGTFIREWPSTMEIQRQTGYANNNIGACCSGKYKQAYGSIWKYKEGLAQ